MKAVVLILIALTIDALQAFISFGLFVIASTGGTLAGGALGCAIGEYVAGQIGCFVGGGILGIFGTLANPALATILVPIGTVLGFAVNVCLSLTLGVGLLVLMWHFKVLSPRYLPGFLTELVPGVNCVPFWTAFVVTSIVRQKATQVVGSTLGLASLGLSPGGLLTSAVKGVVGIRQKNTGILSQSNPGFFNRIQGLAAESDQKKDDTQRRSERTLMQTVDGVRPRSKGGSSKAVGAALGALLFLASMPAQAQMITSQPDPIQFTISPETPGPNELVNITVEGVGTFLGNATITWQQNGMTVVSGVGETRHSFTTGGIGTATTIRITINSPIQGTIVREFVFSPSVINLIWEADTTTPRFYQGKALYSAGSKITVVAFPTVLINGGRVPNSSLSFQWTHGGAVVPAQSGLGKNTFSFYGDQLQDAENVSLETYIGGVKVGAAEITIPAVKPYTVFYSRDPLRGVVLDQALFGIIGLSSKEVTLQAEPYFFTNLSKNRGLLTYSWVLNGQDTTGPDSARGLLTLRQTGTGTGGAILSLAIQNTDPDRMVQSAEQTLQIAFGQKAGSTISSFFGI